MSALLSRSWLPVLAGLVLLLGGGIVHGLWTDRWQPSTVLIDAARRLDHLPTTVGDWISQPSEQDAEILAQTGAAGCYAHTFEDPVTGEQVLVILLVGKAAQMVVHRPEHCYQAAGYTMVGKPTRVEIDPPGMPAAALWTGLFIRDEDKGPGQLRIYWSWLAGDRWEAPTSPRWSLARQPLLYKLYVIRNASTPTTPEGDPCVRLLKELLPRMQRVLVTR